MNVAWEDSILTSTILAEIDGKFTNIGHMIKTKGAKNLHENAADLRDFIFRPLNVFFMGEEYPPPFLHFICS